MRRTALVAIFFGMAAVASSYASVRDVSGQQAGQYFFQITVTYHLTTRYATIRVPTPSVSYSTETNEFHLFDDAPGTGFTVLNMSGTPANWQIAQQYNAGLASAGMWIWVLNSDQTAPYTEYDFQMVLAVKNLNYAYAYGIDQNIARYPSGTNFTNPTQDIDSDHPVIVNAVSAALAQTGNYQVGNLGESEKFHTYMTSLLNFAHNDIATASIILGQGQGGIADCDGLVNSKCAMMRNRGYPCRPLMTGTVQSSVSLGNSMLTNGNGLHSIGEYWNGGKWVDFEGQSIENFALAGQVFLAAVEDLNYAYIQTAGSPPAAITSVSFVGSHAITNSGSFPAADTMPRNIGSKQLFSRLSTANSSSPEMFPPEDTLSPPLHEVTGVDSSPVAGLHLSAQNPARGSSIRLSMTLPEEGVAEVTLLDVSGRRMEVLAPNKIYPAGISTIHSRANHLPPGAYFARLNWKGKSTTTKIMVVR